MDTFKPIGLFRTRLLFLRFFFPILIGGIVLPSWQCLSATIVLDPGHGGKDGGAGGGGEFSENQFAMTLAQTVAGLLGARHQVVLTRTADIEMSPPGRAAVANHRKADLMISLHAAVAPYCGSRSATIYYYSDEHLAFPADLSVRTDFTESGSDRPTWTMLQARHNHQSQLLADTFRRSLVQTAAFDRVTVRGAPLVTLMGADLPAILLEVGCLRPKTEPDPRVHSRLLNDYAESIAKAIESLSPSLRP